MVAAALQNSHTKSQTLFLKSHMGLWDSDALSVNTKDKILSSVWQWHSHVRISPLKISSGQMPCWKPRESETKQIHYICLSIKWDTIDIKGIYPRQHLHDPVIITNDSNATGVMWDLFLLFLKTGQKRNGGVESTWKERCQFIRGIPFPSHCILRLYRANCCHLRNNIFPHSLFRERNNVSCSSCK